MFNILRNTEKYLLASTSRKIVACSVVFLAFFSRPSDAAYGSYVP